MKRKPIEVVVTQFTAEFLREVEDKCRSRWTDGFGFTVTPAQDETEQQAA